MVIIRRFGLFCFFVVGFGLAMSHDVGADPPRIQVGGEAPCRRPWNPPVDAPVVDPFRPPDHTYGPGNRGLEYGAAPGDPVSAVADGVVQFAGPVGGAPVVVLNHGAELLSTYVGLQRSLVHKGQVIDQGQVVAEADVGLHLTARRLGSYLDPAILLERQCVVVALVPLPPSSSNADR